MTRAACTRTASTQDLLAYWLGELDESRENDLEEHLFACAACSERLRTVVELGAAIRNELLRGDFGFVLPAAFIRRLKEAGMRVREYNLEPGASVNCTVTPDDDLVVAHMRAPLGGVRRLDLLIQDSVAGSMRVNDVAFDPAADGVTMVPSVAFLRTLRNERQRVRLLAVDGVEERVLADYTFNHYPST
jgi:putative zinc finger protein